MQTSTFYLKAFFFAAVLLGSTTLYSQDNWVLQGNKIDPDHFLGTINGHPLIFKTDGVQRMILTTTGSIGIGTTTNPLATLDVEGNIRCDFLSGAGNGLVFTDNMGILSRFDFTGNSSEVLTGDGNFHSLNILSGWQISGTNLFSTNTISNVGVGISSPTAKFHIKGAGTNASTSPLKIENSAGGSLFQVNDDGRIGIGSAPVFNSHIYGIYTSSYQSLSASYGINYEARSTNPMNSTHMGAIINGRANNGSGVKTLLGVNGNAIIDNVIGGTMTFAAGIMGQVSGLNGISSQAITEAYGVYGTVGIYDPLNATHLAGVASKMNLGGGNHTNAYLFRGISNPADISTGNITNYYGINIPVLTKTASATVTNAWGAYIQTPTAGTNNFCATFTGSNTKSSTAAFQNIVHVTSSETTNPLALKIGIKTDAQGTNRYGAIEVDDAGVKRNLILEASGGNVGIGTTTPGLGFGEAFQSFVKMEVQAQSGSIAASFSDKSTSTTRRQLFFVPRIGGDGGFNGITRANDYAIFWSDGNGPGNFGDNATAGLVIAPYSFNTSNGIRIDQDGTFQVMRGVTKFSIGSAYSTDLGFGTSYIGFNSIRNEAGGNWKIEGDGAHNGGGLVFSDVGGSMRLITIPSSGGNTRTITDIEVHDNTQLLIKANGDVEIPNGKVGIGATSPEAKFEVEAADAANQVIASFNSKINSTTKRKIFVVPHLANAGYNSLSKEGDAGMFWTDGANNGTNGTEGFVIAPNSASSNGIRIDADGSVGIGTSATIGFNLSVESENKNGIYSLTNHTGDWGYNILAEVDRANTKALAVQNIDTQTEDFVVYGNGRTTIGTPHPNISSMLSVDGKIIAKEVFVTLEDWADFVFDKKYTLMPLTELETFINKNKHLPDVPTEADVKKDGADLGKMNKILLQKIEELTLYMIDLKKENEKMKKQNEVLQNKMEVLELKTRY